MNDVAIHPLLTGAARALGFVALWLKRILNVLVVALIISFVVVALAAVFYRYVLNDSLVWTEEFIRYSLFWVIMLGAALLSYENGHLYIEAIHHFVPPWASKALGQFAHVLTIAFCVILAYQGYILFTRTTGMSPALRLPMRWVYAAMPVGSVAIIIMTLNTMVTGRRAHSEELA